MEGVLKKDVYSEAAPNHKVLGGKNFFIYIKNL